VSAAGTLKSSYVGWAPPEPENYECEQAAFEQEADRLILLVRAETMRGEVAWLEKSAKNCQKLREQGFSDVSDQFMLGYLAAAGWVQLHAEMAEASASLKETKEHHEH
jgi:3-methyladenine DNA glycosylase Tag